MDDCLIPSHQLNQWLSLLRCVTWTPPPPLLTKSYCSFFQVTAILWCSQLHIFVISSCFCLYSPRVKMHRRLVHQEGQGLQRPDHCWAVDAAIALGEVSRSGLFMMCTCLTEVKNWWWRVVSGCMLKVSEHTYHWQCWCKKSNKSVYFGSPPYWISSILSLT